MEHSIRPHPPLYQMAILGALLSAFVASITLALIVRSRHQRFAPVAQFGSPDQSTDHPSAEEPMSPPLQMPGDVEMPSQLPHHFTEELIIPGITETGQDVEEQDNTVGRSPEGV